MEWAKAPEVRDQMVLFPQRLNDVIPLDHTVRLMDDILSRLDWTKWEADYDRHRGQPPIPPRVIASVILYGNLTRIRSSRKLEEALQVRLDFRWLVEGRSIDHTTISNFRRNNADALCDTFVQMGVLARELGWLTLDILAFDGTRLRSNNRRSGSRTRDELRKMKEELAAKFQELEAKTSVADTTNEEVFGNAENDSPSDELKRELADVQRRRARVDAALAELGRAETAGETIPSRVPMTDPESRVTPNKDGGFSPNFTPLATVDVASGMIVAIDVIAGTDEDKHLIPAIESIQEQFGLPAPPGIVLADGMMSTADNLSECQTRNIDLYSPISLEIDPENPALRSNPTEPVAAKLIDRLPSAIVKGSGRKATQFSKQAFVYDKENNCYYCPNGKTLSLAKTSTETRASGMKFVRSRFKASPADCQACPLLALCVAGKAKQRTLSRETHEDLREAHAKKMATEAAQEIYAKRRHPGERPFAVIKQTFGARNFLLRGLKNVRQEWRWLASSFNLDRLMSLMRIRAGPTMANLRDIPFPLHPLQPDVHFQRR
jgi:transposase